MASICPSKSGKFKWQCESVNINRRSAPRLQGRACAGDLRFEHQARVEGVFGGAKRLSQLLAPLAQGRHRRGIWQIGHVKKTRRRARLDGHEVVAQLLERGDHPAGCRVRQDRNIASCNGFGQGRPSLGRQPLFGQLQRYELLYVVLGVWTASGPIAKGVVLTLLFMGLVCLFVSIERLWAFRSAVTAP